MSPLNYQETVQKIEALGIMPDRPPSLDVVKNALKRFRFSIPEEQIIVVAGTNGKGTVCASLESLLLSAKKTVGTYTSPHLIETTERFRFNGLDISQELFCQAYQAIIEVAPDLILTHFEILTLMAVWIFFSGETNPAVDYGIFEVGLGGTWDATNAIPHRHCIITSLGYDHQNLLGNTLTEIAANKFGIVTHQANVVYSPLPPEIRALAQAIQTQTQSHWTESVAFDFRVERKDREPSFILNTAWGSTQLSLPGSRAAQNSATALTAFQTLGFNPELHLSALSQVRWPGRMEKIHLPEFSCPVYLSGDHNPAGAQSLLDLLSAYPRKHLYMLIGIGKDKDADQICSLFYSLPSASFFLTETPFKGRKLESYGHWLEKSQGSHSDPFEALKLIQNKADPQDLVVITGSLYLVGLFRIRAAY